jgi:hypothetical protein
MRYSLKTGGRDMRVGPMAVQTPAHRERSHLLDAVHSFDRPVTLLASYTGQYVLAMVEIDEVWEVVDLDPPDRPLLLHRLLQFFDFDGLLLEQVVAVHANAGRRNARMSAGSRREMAVQTRHLVIAGMDPMRKCDGLIGRVALMDSDARQLPRN